MDLSLRIGEATRTARVTRRGKRLVVRLDGGAPVELTARLLADGTWRLAILDADGAPARLLSAAQAGRGRAAQLWIEGRTVAYQRVEDASAREAGAEGSLAATIPAVVLEVLVAPGEAVAEGDRLVLLESMKMVMPIVAPHAGVVASVHCAPGDSVAPGVALVALRAADEAT